MPGGGISRIPPSAKSEDVPEPDGRFTLGNFSIDEYKPIKVIVIGAGFSGILAGIRFPQKIPNVELTIYEKSAGVGGTWYNNRFPGLTCDIPAHTYQYSFEDKRDWSALYAPGDEIQAHLQDVVDKYKLAPHIRLSHEVVRAQYAAPAGKWRVRVRRPVSPSPSSSSSPASTTPSSDTGKLEYEEIEDTADVLVTAFGPISRWRMPDIEGIGEFGSELHHTAGYRPPAGEGTTWKDDLGRWRDKRVGVIGSGSTAIQVVTALAPHVPRLANYVRGQTWLSPPFAMGLFAELLGRERGAPENEVALRPEELERFKADAEFFRSLRCTLEESMNSMHSYTQLGSEMQAQFQAAFRKNMEEKLAERPDIARKLIPGFPVSCRRLTPGPGYLETLCEEHVEFISSPIKRFTKTGIETEDGKHQELDLVFCATGYDASWQLPFEIVGRDGVSLNERWKPHPSSYLSVCVDGFPNMFMSLGPNSFIGAGMLIPIIEFAVAYAVQATAKLQRERLKSMEVKARAVRDFDRYIDSYFPQSVFSAKCRSWYKLGKEEGRVVGLWPGSSLHAMRALQYPRWEDYDYESDDADENLMYWLGDGQTWNEKSLTGDRAWYLREDFVDRPPVPRN